MSWELFQSKFPKKYDVMVIAHRGACTEAPENTIRAFEQAVDAGAEMIEFDTHKTIDNHVVVIHDRTTVRTSNMDIMIHTSTLEQVREVSLEDDLQIPTLEEVFVQLKGKIYFQIEITAKKMAPEVLALIDKYDLYNQCLISSFLDRTLPTYKNSKKKILLAYIGHEQNSLLRKAAKLDLDGVHPQYKMLTPELVSKFHSEDLFVNAWPVDNPKEWEYLIKCGVDGIITNYPRELVNYLETR